MVWQSPRGKIVWKRLIVITSFIVPTPDYYFPLSLLLRGVFIPWLWAGVVVIAMVGGQRLWWTR